MTRREPNRRGGVGPQQPRLGNLILAGLIAGIMCGVFFGPYCGRLKIVGEAFVALLQMTVLPYIVVSLVANLAKLRTGQGRRLVLVGGLVMLALWSLGMLSVAVFQSCFPEWKSGSFFSTTMADGKVKYVWIPTTGRELLFDLSADPQELHDLSADPAAGETLALWRSHLVEALAGREADGLVRDGRLTPGAAPPVVRDWVLDRARG